MGAGKEGEQAAVEVWSVMSTLSARSITDAADWDHYVDHCRQASIEADDKTYRMLERTRVMLESGLLLGVRANDMSYLAIFPEPKAASGAPPFSHLLTAWAETPTICPSCSRVNPRSLRSAAIRSFS